MEFSGLAKKIEASLPGSVLERGTFGRPPIPSIWIEAARIRDVAEWINSEAKDCVLEDLCVAQVEQALLISYFIERSGGDVCVLRVSTEVPDPQSRPVIPSVARDWPAAEPLEKYAAAMFGIDFTDRHGVITPPPFLPEGWLGYPLRKSYVFPREFFGISHGASDVDA